MAQRQVPSNLGEALSRLYGSGENKLQDLLNQLCEDNRLMSAFKVTVADGAAAGADVTVTGIATTDKLKSVINTTGWADLTSEFSISAANIIKNSAVYGTDTSGDKLLVIWIDKSELKVIKSS